MGLILICCQVMLEITFLLCASVSPPEIEGIRLSSGAGEIALR